MSQRDTQAQRILKLLQRYSPNEVSLVEILDLHIAQFGARILELRRAGYDIRNRRETANDGTVHSWYKLVTQQRCQCIGTWMAGCSLHDPDLIVEEVRAGNLGNS